MNLLGIGPIGWTELLVILGVILLLFGNRMPTLMRNLGRSVTGFKSGLKEGAEEEEKRKVGEGRR